MKVFSAGGEGGVSMSKEVRRRGEVGEQADGQPICLTGGASCILISTQSDQKHKSRV